MIASITTNKITLNKSPTAAQTIAFAFVLLVGFSIFSTSLYAQATPEPITRMMAQGRYTQAVHQLARIPPAQRNHTQTIQLARCYLHLQHYSAATETLNTLNTAAQQRLEVVLLYVDIDYAQDLWQRAAQRLQAVAHRYAAYPGFVLRYAQVHQALGNQETAQTAYSYYGVLRQTAAQGTQQ